MSSPLRGAIEAGGTKFVCGIGTCPDDLQTIHIPTTTPRDTLDACIRFLQPHALVSVGIASFGPVDLATGRITSTPKPGWSHCDISGAIRRGLGLPVAFDTDVNGAALGEARWGAAQGLSDFLYLTVGTGIGGGAVVAGRILHGSSHPEMGHIRVPRITEDTFPGACPFHQDCLEGLASGPAMQARWGMPAHELPPRHQGWRLEARYLALGIVNWMTTLAPQRIILGGGLSAQLHLFPLITTEIDRLLNGYFPSCDVVPARLGSRAGVLGALVLAESAH